MRWNRAFAITVVVFATTLAVACGETDSDSDPGTGGVDAGGTGGGTGGAGGTGGDAGHGGDAGLDASSFEECFSDAGAFSNYDLKICDPVLSECIFAAHQTDCCGTILYIGLQQDQLAKFAECESAWRAKFPPCGCAPGPSSVEQAGNVAGESDVAVDCVNCTTTSCICITSPK